MHQPVVESIGYVSYESELKLLFFEGISEETNSAIIGYFNQIICVRLQYASELLSSQIF